jgi:hypothetical protein
LGIIRKGTIGVGADQSATPWDINYNIQGNELGLGGAVDCSRVSTALLDAIQKLLPIPSAARGNQTVPMPIASILDTPLHRLLGLRT